MVCQLFAVWLSRQLPDMFMVWVRVWVRVRIMVRKLTTPCCNYTASDTHGTGAKQTFRNM